MKYDYDTCLRTFRRYSTWRNRAHAENDHTAVRWCEQELSMWLVRATLANAKGWVVR